jgi:type II secretion system protein I
VQKKSPDPFFGFTLLEIILALAILAGSLAALGEVMRLADQNAAMTRDETQAQLLASSIMDELVSGAMPLSAVNQAQCDVVADPPWLYSVSIEQTGHLALLAVRVQVQQQLDPVLQPARFELVRWLSNPNYVPASNEQSSQPNAATGSGGSSTGIAGGSGGNAAGAQQ